MSNFRHLSIMFLCILMELFLAFLNEPLMSDDPLMSGLRILNFFNIFKALILQVAEKHCRLVNSFHYVVTAEFAIVNEQQKMKICRSCHGLKKCVVY